MRTPSRCRPDHARQGGSLAVEARPVIAGVLPVDHRWRRLPSASRSPPCELGQDIDRPPGGARGPRAWRCSSACPSTSPARPGPELWLYLVAVLGRFPVALGGGGRRAGPGARRPRRLTAHALDVVRRDAVQRSGRPADGDRHRPGRHLRPTTAPGRTTTPASSGSPAPWPSGGTSEHGAVAVADIDERTAYRNLAPPRGGTRLPVRPRRRDRPGGRAGLPSACSWCPSGRP